MGTTKKRSAAVVAQRERPLAVALRALRSEVGLTQEELAEATGGAITRSHVSQAECGRASFSRKVIRTLDKRYPGHGLMDAWERDHYPKMHARAQVAGPDDVQRAVGELIDAIEGLKGSAAARAAKIRYAARMLGELPG